MKIISYTVSFLALVASVQAQSEICCGGEASTQHRFRDAATHEMLVERSKNVINPLSSLKPAEPRDEAEVFEPYQPKSLLERSEVLQAGGLATLVPKRAVIHLPERLKGAMSLPEGVQIVTWREFYRKNYGWIDTVEVNRAQAEGQQPLSEELIKSFEKRTNIVVAVLKGGPISVMPLVEPPAEVAGDTTIPATVNPAAR